MCTKLSNGKIDFGAHGGNEQKVLFPDLSEITNAYD